MNTAAAVARWLTELFNDDDFRAKSKTRLAGVEVSVGKVRTPARPLLPQKQHVLAGQGTYGSSMARLRDSLSNRGGPLFRLFEALDQAETVAKPQVTVVEADPAVAIEVRECRMLSPEEVAELVEAYRRGAGQRELAKRYGVHRHTVDRHLERAGVAKRAVVKMTPARVEQAKELYQQGLSTNQIGRKLGVSGSTVWKALKRAGVRMR